MTGVRAVPQQQSTQAALEEIIDAYQQGDSDGLVARIHDGVDLLRNAPIALVRFAGRRRGKAEVLKGSDLMYKEFRPIKYEVRVTIVVGD